ncbi:MAG: tetratricopeptide repeat protein [Pseudomonadota bacterium]
MSGLIDAGRAYLEAGNTDAAARAAKQLLMEDPNDRSALELLCDSHFQDRDYRAASEVVEQLLRLAPNSLEAHVRRVLVYIECGWQDPAKAALDQFRETLPGYPDAYEELLGYYELVFGNSTHASERLQAMLERRPDDISLRRMIILSEVDARNPFRALPHIEAILAVVANDQVALRTLAFCRFRQFRFGEARKLAKAARRLDPLDRPLRWITPLSFVVWFPPFLVGHILQWGMAKTAQLLGGKAGHAIGIAIIAAIIGTVISLDMSERVGDAPPSQLVAYSILGAILAGMWAFVIHYVVGVQWDDPDDNGPGSLRLPGY